MQIEFLWIEHLQAIKGQGFNFNPNAHYSFNDEKGELQRTAQESIPNDFFHKDVAAVDRVSALIGANGTGKSTILDFITYFLTSNLNVRGLIVTNKYVFNKLRRPVTLISPWQAWMPKILDEIEMSNFNRQGTYFADTDHEKAKKVRNSYLHILGNVLHDTTIISFSGAINTEETGRVYQNLQSRQDELANGHYVDISDIALMSRDQQSAGPDKPVYTGVDPVLSFRAGESQRFLRFIKGDLRHILPFTYEEIRFAVRFSDIDGIFFQSYDEIAFKPLSQALQSLMSAGIFEMTKNNVALLNILAGEGFRGYFTQKIEDALKDPTIEKKKVALYHRLLIRTLRQRVLDLLGEITGQSKFANFSMLIKELSVFTSVTDNYIEQIKNYFKLLGRRNTVGKLSIEEFDKFYDSFSGITDNTFEETNWEIYGARKPLSEVNFYDTFFNSLNELDIKSGLPFPISSLFDFDITGLSTGEKQFLKFFSRLSELPHFSPDDTIQSSNIILLLDEFDLGFHPLWQKKYLSKLIAFLEKLVIHSGKGINIQIILTSHSPFLVSDLPKQCINFLNKPKGMKYSIMDSLTRHQDTFGANIHELLTDSFFMEGAMIGDLAKDKINEALKNLTTLHSDLKHTLIQTLIRIVGEPLIKVKLAEMYAARTNNNQELAKLKAQQDYIIQRIKEIETDVTNKEDETT